MNWIDLKTTEQAQELINKSDATPVLFFKHSTRCSISTMALSRLERQWNLPAEKITAVYLDLLNYRDISNFLAQTLGVEHQSPQVILVKNGKAVYSETHSMINVEAISENLI